MNLKKNVNVTKQIDERNLCLVKNNFQLNLEKKNK